mgnify:FL=1
MSPCRHGSQVGGCQTPKSDGAGFIWISLYDAGRDGMEHDPIDRTALSVCVAEPRPDTLLPVRSPAHRTTFPPVFRRMLPSKKEPRCDSAQHEKPHESRKNPSLL